MRVPVGLARKAPLPPRVLTNDVGILGVMTVSKQKAAVPLLLLLLACQRPAGQGGEHGPVPPPGPGSSPVQAQAEGRLEITDLVVGGGAEATTGRSVFVHYTGRLTDGTKFDSSHDRGEPIRFVLGRGMVIPGWEQGIAGMKVGSKRKLVIPPHLAYGDRGAGATIPPNATLVFEVELTAVD
jgi:hypothetical protein